MNKRSTRIFATVALTLGLGATSLPAASAQQEGYTSSQQISADLLAAGSSWLLAPGNPVGGSVIGSSNAFFCAIETIFGTEQQREAVCG